MVELWKSELRIQPNNSSLLRRREIGIHGCFSQLKFRLHWRWHVLKMIGPLVVRSFDSSVRRTRLHFELRDLYKLTIHNDYRSAASRYTHNHVCTL
jgi:hypothetical protein